MKVGARAKWWLELLGARDAVLARLGEPVVVNDTPLKETPKIEPVEPPPPVVSIVAAPSPPNWRRPTGIALIGGGVVAAGVGVVLGVQSQAALNKVRVALKDGGVITSMTQREAAALDGESRSKALVGNVLMAAGAAVAAAGLVLTLTAGEAQVVVAPGPAGATISGRL